jgi:hypothetical protein
MRVEAKHKRHGDNLISEQLKTKQPHKIMQVSKWGIIHVEEWGVFPIVRHTTLVIGAIGFVLKHIDN